MDYAFNLFSLKTPSIELFQVQNSQLAPGLQQIMDAPSGHTQPMSRAVIQANPEITFQTTQLTTLLASCGIFGSSLSGGNTDLTLRRISNLGTRYANNASQHQRFRATSGMLYWRSLSVSHAGIATADCRLALCYDGTNPILTPAGSVTVSGTATSVEQFTLGPVAINGTTIEGISDISIALNHQMFEQAADGNLHNTMVAVDRIDPVITINTLSSQLWNTYGINGTALTSLTIYQRRINREASSCV